MGHNFWRQSDRVTEGGKAREYVAVNHLAQGWQAASGSEPGTLRSAGGNRYHYATPATGLGGWVVGGGGGGISGGGGTIMFANNS